MDAFSASGRRDAATILEEVSAELQRASCAIDIGCGCGKAGDSDVWSAANRVIGDRRFAHDARAPRRQLPRETQSENVEPMHAEDAWEQREGDLVSSPAGSSSSIWKPARSRAIVRHVLGRSQQEALPIFAFDTRERSVIYRLRRQDPGRLPSPNVSKRASARSGVQPTRFGGSSTPPALERGQRAPTGRQTTTPSVLRRSDAISVNE